MKERESEILELVKNNREVSSREVFEGVSASISYATVKRILARLIEENLLESWVGHLIPCKFTSVSIIHLVKVKPCSLKIYSISTYCSSSF